MPPAPSRSEDPVVAQDQAEGLAGADAAGLVFGQQALLDQSGQQHLEVGAAQQFLAGRIGECLPVLEAEPDRS